MKKILIPIDFSQHSEYAAKLASKISRVSKSELHVIHVIKLPKGGADMSSKGATSVPENILYIRKTKELLETFIENYFFKNKNITQTILFDTPYEGILSYTKKTNPDLIVMGSKGHSKTEELLIGSNTNKIIQTSKTPVLMVKKDESKFKLKNLVYASDFKNDKEKNETLNKLINLAKKFKTTFHLVKINTPSKFENTQISKQKMELFAKKYELSKYTINSQNDSSIDEGIVNFSNEVSSDIIALEANGRNMLSHILNRSITKYVSATALQPVIVFKT